MKKKKVLSVDTSTRFGSMGIYEVTDHIKPLAEKKWEGYHSEWIVGFLKELLTSACVQPSCFDEIYVGVGPGSFTGLRVAINMVRGLSYSFSLPIMAIDSLSVVAWPCAEKKTLGLVKSQKKLLLHQFLFQFIRWL